MSGKIDEALVRHVAHLSRLALTDAEVSAMAGELSRIVAYIDLLAEVPTEGVEPTAYALALRNVFRADEVCPSLGAARALANAAESEASSFKVPKVLDVDAGG